MSVVTPVNVVFRLPFVVAATTTAPAGQVTMALFNPVPVSAAEMDAPVVAEIHEAIAASPIRAEITDLHVWRVGKGQYASIVSLAVANDIDVEPEYFRRQIGIHEELVHITVEVNQRERS